MDLGLFVPWRPTIPDPSLSARLQRISDSGGGRALYTGVTSGLRCPWDEYLKTMLQAKTEQYEVSSLLV